MPDTPPDLLNPDLAKALFERFTKNPLKGLEGPVKDTPGAKPSTWKDEPVKYTFDSAMEALKGLTIGESDKPGQNWRNGGALFGAAIPLGGAMKGALKGGLIKEAGTTGPGLYSKLEEVFSKAAGKMHPSKAASVAKSGAKAEEITARKLPEFLAAKGETPVTGPEVMDHLKQNPVNISLKTLGAGEPHKLQGAKVVEVVQHPTQRSMKVIKVDKDGVQHSVIARNERFNGGDVWTGRIDEFDDPILAGSLDDLTKKLEEHLASKTVASPTEYRQYTYPGGENYQENLFHYKSPEVTQLDELQEQELNLLARPVRDEDAIRELRKQIDEVSKKAKGYRSAHFDGNSDGLIAHSRTTDRYAHLPESEWVKLDESKPPKLMGQPGDEYYQFNFVDPQLGEEHVGYGKTMQEAKDSVIGYMRGYENQPKGPKGRFIEEIQSDWHQAGRDKGYSTPEMRQQRQELNRQRDALADRSRQIRAEVSRHSSDIDELLITQQLPEDHPKVKEALARQQAAYDQLDEVDVQRDAVAEQLSKIFDAVADAPFKENWPDLVLKQQLMDAAKDPEISWLGTSTAQPHIDRYGSERVSWQPETTSRYQRLKNLPIATTPIEELMAARAELAADSIDLHHQFPKEGEWSMLFEPQVGGRGEGIEDLGEEALRRRLIENTTETVKSPEDLRGLSDYGVNPQRVWKRIQANPDGGEYLPRREGMETFYDQMVPNKLEKLLKPFGGRVEKAEIPYTKSSGYYTAPKQTSFGAWVVKLSPEMKQRILKEGFPLMAALFMAYEKEMASNAQPTEQ